MSSGALQLKRYALSPGFGCGRIDLRSPVLPS
jgi:hypothetical protein